MLTSILKVYIKELKKCTKFCKKYCTNILKSIKVKDSSPAFLTSDDFIRSNEIIGTKWLIYYLLSYQPFCTDDLMISLECKKSR